MGKMRISVVVPLYNEERVVVKLHTILRETMDALGAEYEIIFVDDGSRDGTFKVMSNLSPLTAIRLKSNFGQTQALAAGIKLAKNNAIVLMDGDLENDPRDIPKLLQTLDEGYDIVSGWRRDRWKDRMFSRRFPSTFANLLISFVSGVKLHDHGCTLKAYRREVLDKIHFTGDMHRMIAAYAAREGARITEIPVRFEPREYGKSHYGFSRTFKVLLDILAFHFFYKYAQKPIHFFGGVGFLSFFVSFITFCIMLYLKYFRNTTFIQTPLPVLTALFAIIGFQFILMGLLAEIFVRERNADVDCIAEVRERK